MKEKKEMKENERKMKGRNNYISYVLIREEKAKATYYLKRKRQNILAKKRQKKKERRKEACL